MDDPDVRLSQKRIRDARLELLRIVAMIMVIGRHLFNSTLPGFFETATPMNKYLDLFVGDWGQLGVFIFVAITCYFMVDRNRTKVRKMIDILALPIFYTAVIFLIYLFTAPELIPDNWIMEMIFSPCDYWFVNTYVIFYMLLPLLWAVSSYLSDRTVVSLIVIISVLTSIQLVYTGTHDSMQISFFILVYFLVLYTKRVPENWMVKYSGTACIVSIVSIFIGTCITAYLGELEWMKILYFRNIVLAIAGVTLVYSALKMKPFESRVISLFGASTFGIYVLHNHTYIAKIGVDGQASLLWNNLLDIPAAYQEPWFFLYAIAVILIIFVICGIIDILRHALYMYLFDNKLGYLNKLCGIFDFKYTELSTKLAKK